MSMSTQQLALLVRQFLQLATGLKAKYSYPVTTPQENEVVLTYQFIGGQQISVGIGNELLAERKLFVATVQAKTAKQVMFYTDMIKMATNRTQFVYISDSTRPDAAVRNRWIGTVTLMVYTPYNFGDAPQTFFTPEEARKLLQAFADRFLFNTTIYRDDLSQATFDRYIVPELNRMSLEEMFDAQQQIIAKIIAEDTDRLIYGEQEVRAMLQDFADKFILNTNVYGELLADAKLDNYEVPPLTEEVQTEILDVPAPDAAE